MAKTGLATKRSPGSAKLVGKVLAFVLQAPETVERLTLTASGMPELQLVELAREDFAGAEPEALAEGLVDRAEEYAETLDRETRFTLVFHREGAAIMTTVFRAGINWNGGGVGTQFDGTTADIIGQMQRHLEAQQRTMHAAFKTVLEGQAYVIEQQRLEMADMRKTYELVKAKEEQQRLDELEAIIEESEGGDEQRILRLASVVTDVFREFKGGKAEGASASEAPKEDTTKH